MSGNDFVKFFLRTPLRILMGNTMLITVTGYKTGRRFTTPVNYYQGNDCLWVMTCRNRTWWRNVKYGAPVSLLLNGKTIEAYAEAELGESAVTSRLVEYLQKTPMAARSLGIRIQDGIPNANDVERVVRDRLFVRIKPSIT